MDSVRSRERPPAYVVKTKYDLDDMETIHVDVIYYVRCIAYGYGHTVCVLLCVEYTVAILQ